MRSPSDGSTEDPVLVFGRYLKRLEAGEPVDFDSWCADQGDRVDALRELHARWTAMASYVGRADWRPDEVERRLLALVARESDGLSIGGLAVPMGRLRRRGWDEERFEDRGEVARGAMGRIVRIWDRELRRSMAKKELVERRGAAAESDHERAVRLGRFLEEAQITAQLDHPGIVPVHDLGVDASGKAFFTMRLVRGEDLRSVFDKVQHGKDGWTLTRALGVLAKLCEALAFAHSKGVVHRDLKPANVMVGRFGEVYVMDWGLARVMDRPDARDLRVQDRSHPPSVELTTARTDAESSHGSPLRTMDGHVVGTPAYMPPEQALGDIAHLGPRSDVYAVGAMLYHLLAGRMPYLDEVSPRSPYEVWNEVRAHAPKPIRSLARGRPPELIAICEKAMARDPQARYADMRELAEDLSRFLENRVVRAYRTGPWREFVKWTQRNPLASGSAAALLVVTLGAALLVASEGARRLRVERRALDEHLAPILALRADVLWPIHPDSVLAMNAWLDDARSFAARAPEYEARLQSLRGKGDRSEVPESERGSRLARATLTELRTRLDTLEQMNERTLTRLESEPPASARAVEDRRIADVYRRELTRLRSRIDRAVRDLGPAARWTFDSQELTREHARLEGLVANLRSLTDRPGGLIAEVEWRRDAAAGLAATSIYGHAAGWRLACEDVADPRENAWYDGLHLEPLLGLVPLRRDPDSGLWEFWHVLSGERPEPRPEGGYLITPESGIVMVLVPGGYLMLGCHEDTLDERAEYEFTDEIGEHDLELAPYLLSKYEMTQGQWLRLTGESCGEYWAGEFAGQDPLIDLTHPVQGLDSNRALELLARWGLSLPTEAQWEHAALAGLPAAQEWRASVADLERDANLYFDQDQSEGPLPQVRVPWSGLTGDTYILHSPVGYFPPDAWGFHDMIGNVAEWCRDDYNTAGYREKNTDGVYELLPSDPRTGEMYPRNSHHRVLRGGSYRVEPARWRLSERVEHRKDLPFPEGGARPSLDLPREWNP